MVDSYYFLKIAGTNKEGILSALTQNFLEKNAN